MLILAFHIFLASYSAKHSNHWQKMSAQATKPTTQTTTAQTAPTATVHLKLRPKKKAVVWTEDVVDNENMGKRSSKSTPQTSILFGETSFRHLLTCIALCAQFVACMSPTTTGTLTLPVATLRATTNTTVRDDFRSFRNSAFFALQLRLTLEQLRRRRTRTPSPSPQEATQARATPV